MTNYERIQQDKAFCASVMADVDGCGNVVAWEKWLDTEQREVSDEREHKEDAKPDDVSQWPDWKKRAALCNYEFGKEGL